MRRFTALLGALLVASLLTGCIGQNKATGKFSNQDKPKPAEGK